MKLINSSSKIITHTLKDDGRFPNNSLPLIIYKDALTLPEKKAATIIITLFENNNWKNAWKNGIYDYDHYHSITHEVLGIYCGKAKVQFGGPGGVVEKVRKGDVIIIPAGVAHRNLGSGKDFKCVGAYPGGNDYDIRKGEEGDRPESDNNIKKVPMPVSHPISGIGKMKTIWNDN